MRIYLTPADAGHELGVTPATVRNWADRNVLPVAAKTRKGIRLFDETSVLELAQRRDRGDAT